MHLTTGRFARHAGKNGMPPFRPGDLAEPSVKLDLIVGSPRDFIPLSPQYGAIVFNESFLADRRSIAAQPV